MSRARRSRRAGAAVVAETGRAAELLEERLLLTLSVNDMATGGQTPLLLAQSLVGTGIAISNVTYTGSTQSGGFFTGGLSEGLGIDSGVILSTGRVSTAPGPNTSSGTTGSMGTAGDAELATIVGRPVSYLRDAAVLEFDFIPTGPLLSFNYVFASEEYPEYAPSTYNDAFALIVDGVNVALIPNTSTPVTINNVRAGLNSSYFNSNRPVINYGTSFDGFTVLLAAQTTVTVGMTHHIKFAVADVSDSSLDSAVFIQAGSLSSYQSDMGVTGTAAPSPVDQNSPFQYDFTISNGNNPATGVQFILDLPASLTNVNVTTPQGTVTVNGSQVIVDIGDMAATSLTTVTVSGIPSAGGTITAVAQVLLNENDPDTSNNVISIDTTVNPLNTAPVNTLPAGPLATSEDTSLAITGISVADADAGNSTIAVRLTVQNGTLAVLPGVVGGLSAGQITTNNTSDVVLVGSQAQINATLAATNGLVYRGTLNFNGSDVLAMISYDQGNTGVGGPLSDTDTINITVAAINDPPVHVVPLPQSVNEDAVLTFSTATGNALVVTDVDASTGTVQTIVSVDAGILTLATTNNLTVFNDNSSQVTLQGSLADINAALDGLTFTPPANFNGSVTLTMATDDFGNSGSGGSQFDSDNLQIDVLSQNDLPTLSTLADQTTLEDTSTAALAVTLADIEDAAGTLSLTATSSNTTLVPNGSIVFGGSDGSRTVTITPAADQNGTTVVTLFVTDSNGGVTSTSFTVTVVAVNDAPQFTKGADQSVRADVGPVTVSGWATGMSPGPADEAGQSVYFAIVSNSNPALFSTAPVVNPTTGQLSYTPRGDQLGTATIGVRIYDSGGTSNGGVNISAIQTFTITITVPATRRFEFNSSANVLTSGYTSVRGSNRYSVPNGVTSTFGWYNIATEANAKSTSLASNTLLYDGHYSRDNTFIADVPNGDYMVSMILGDYDYARDRISIYTQGSSTAAISNLSTARGVFRQLSLPVTVSNGRVMMRFFDAGGDPFVTVHTLEIRPAENVLNTLTITRGNPQGTGTLSGDGASIDTFYGTGATPNAMVTLTTTAGTITTADQSSAIVGTQVLADASGNFTFNLLRPNAVGPTTASLAAEEITGAHQGSFTQQYDEPASRLFDMNYGNSPTLSGYIGVLNSTVYTATRGYGWLRAVSGADRGANAGPDSMLRDLNFGNDGTFRVRVDADSIYTVTLRFRDTYAHDKINVYVEGSTTPVTAGLTNLTITPNSTSVHTFVATASDGILDLRFRDLSTSGDRNWIVNAIEVVRSTQLAADVGSQPNAGSLSSSDLTPLVAEAISRWERAGLTASQVAALRNAEFRIQNLGGRDLGLTASSHVIFLDDNAAGHGWFVDATPGGDSEFSSNVHGGLIATNGPAAGRIDLLTVILHELGHVVGLESTSSGNGLMAAVLPAGTRRAISAADTDAVFGALSSSRLASNLLGL